MLLDFLNNFFLSFIPMFVAVDAIGVLPIFASLTVGLSREKHNKIIIQSMVTAICLAIGFVLIGGGLFKFLHIEMGDFMVAGGVILFCIAIIEIVSPSRKRHTSEPELGAVPIGTPLIAGPAVLTTSMLSVSQYGMKVTIISILINILLAGLIFKTSSGLMKFLGAAGSKALSKIFSLLLAAIAVMLIRRGLEQLVKGF
jgi:multiple antibiotic resistance protein